jgi:crotonobetainyl-CoA:carnitine CoA-transferase CaiB-like acyl-CoA transferase
VSGPLAGVRVLDLSRVLAGPSCTMILGDLGAEVIKVERPDGGDDTREGVEAVRALAAASDVFVENFRVGALGRMGLAYADHRAVNPGIVYCSITGYGQTGPYRDLAGYDFILQAMSGLMSIAGEPDGEPMRLGVATVDLTAGLYAAVGILAGPINTVDRVFGDPQTKERGMVVEMDHTVGGEGMILTIVATPRVARGIFLP